MRRRLRRSAGLARCAAFGMRLVMAPRMRDHFLWFILALPAVAACSDPCLDYCERFMERTNECGLGGPQPTERLLDECADEISSQFQDETCEDVTRKMDSMSCGEFTALVCSEP